MACFAPLASSPASDRSSGAESSGRPEPIAVQANALEVPEKTGRGWGGLSIEAAFDLRSSDQRFGGLSGLWLSDDAKRLIAVSDEGLLWQARLEHDIHGRLLNIDSWTMSGITKRPEDIEERFDFDAEALAWDGERGLVIAFEGDHRLRRLPLSDLQAMPDRLPLPNGLGGHSNSGIEALASLEGGKLLAIAERVGAWGGVGLSAWLIDGDRIDDLVYVPTPGFAPTGADRLDDAIYIVERQFSLLGGFQSRLITVPAHEIRPGNHLHGRKLAAFRFGDIGENFEGIAAKRAPDGRTLIYLLADDNFSFLQRTVLLQLCLPMPASLETADGPDQADVLVD